jgi:hypothetical protein
VAKAQLILELKSQLYKAESQTKILDKERQKLRQRCIKLREKRGMFVKNLQVCMNCAKEYSEDANFNWSCRTHHSEYSGEMWWCCGKTKKEALGCKFKKHKVRSEQEEEVELLDEGKEGISKNIKCKCCH